ncbi:transmembrane protein 53-like [Cottoperca gobio]|uniref:Transmembrane protein 53-like n=1 Tax=Cottoperca gobio TaxID=56716 RepID=A0A6J2S7T6_COTGO|nr:transmembrane protein 53-like [Cottoperca gobio]
MGNLLRSIGVFKSDATMSDRVIGGRFITRRISKGITYYHAPFSEAGEQTCAEKVSQSSTALCQIVSPSPPALPLSDSAYADHSFSPLLSDSPSHPLAPSQHQSHSAPAARPLLIFFSWLGAQTGAVAKYRDLYLDRGIDVLLVQSNVMHFLWPRWGLDYGLDVLNVLEDPQFSGRAVLVHASSIGGYTFTQTLTHIAQGQNKHADVAKRVIGHIYDSLVCGTLEHMAIGLGKTLAPRLETFVKHIAMFYFWLFKTHTADFYNKGVQVFQNNPITAPALFFYSENDALCNLSDLETIIDHWKRRGLTVEWRKWKESKHAAHMQCHREDYICTLDKFLNLLPISSFQANM